jgi:hypothetical protein
LKQVQSSWILPLLRINRNEWSIDDPLTMS